MLAGLSPPGSPRKALKRTKPLTLLPLVVLIFFEVSGGPFGTEVGAGGWVACMQASPVAAWGAGACPLALGLPSTLHCLQDAVIAGGPLLTVLGFLILPLVWSVPEALVSRALKGPEGANRPW